MMSTVLEVQTSCFFCFKDFAMYRMLRRSQF